MRMALAVFALALCILASANGQDVRTVNGISVDLQPLLNWLAKPEGERPLKHWKQVQVLAVKEDVAIWPKCSIRCEGAEVEVLLANMPAQIKPMLAALKQQSAQIAALQTRTAALADDLRRISADVHDANMDNINNGFAPIYYVRESSKVTLEDMQMQLSRLENEHAATVARAKDETSLLAMFTGKTYAGLPIWDCGKKP